MRHLSIIISMLAVLLLFWFFQGCGESNESFQLDIIAPDQTAKEAIKTLLVYAIISNGDETNCQNLMNGSVSPNDSNISKADSESVSDPINNKIRPLKVPKKRTGTLLFFSQGEDGNGNVIFRGCANSGTSPITIALTICYQLTVIAGSDGTITVPSSSPVTVASGTAANITASPNTGYGFVDWTEVTTTGVIFGDSKSESTTVTLTGGDATIQANFTYCCTSNDECLPTSEGLHSCSNDTCGKCVLVEPLTITPTTLPAATVGQSNYSVELTVAGGRPPYTWGTLITGNGLEWLTLVLDDNDNSKAWLQNAVSNGQPSVPSQISSGIPIKLVVLDNTKHGTDLGRVDNQGAILNTNINIVSAAPPSNPGAPTVTSGNAQLSVSWASVSGATAYEVWYSITNNSATATQQGGDITTTSYTITGLTNGTLYYVWLTVKNSAGTSGFSASASGTPHGWVLVGNADFSARAAYSPSIAIDASGTPYVAYSDEGNSLGATVMKYNGSNWVPVGKLDFSDGVAHYTGIVLDASGTPYVVFRDYGNSSKAKVMKYNGSNWETVGNADFSDGGVSYISIAIDSSGTPYVAYMDSSHSNKATVMKLNGSTWVPVGSPGFGVSAAELTKIALDSSGTPYVVYRDDSNSYKATVMKFNGSSWLPVGNPGLSDGDASSPGIAIDSSDTPYVVYQDGGNSYKATVMKFNGSSWLPVGNPGFSTWHASFTSIALNSSDTPYVVYQDNDNSNKATVMKYNGSNWVPVGKLGFSANEADYPSIAINSSGTPYIVFCDYGNSLKATVMRYQ